MVVLEEEEDGPSADCSAVLVQPHTLEPGYSHLYSIPQQQHRRGAAARVTLAFREDGDAAVCLLLCSGDRLRVACSL